MAPAQLTVVRVGTVAPNGTSAVCPYAMGNYSTLFKTAYVDLRARLSLAGGFPRVDGVEPLPNGAVCTATHTTNADGRVQFAWPDWNVSEWGADGELWDST
jgi:hypothetical protein